MALADQSADMGLMPTPAVPQRKVLLLRLVMSQGGEPRSSIDLVIVPGPRRQPGRALPGRASSALQDRHHRRQRSPPVALGRSADAQGRGETLAALATSLKPVPGQVLDAGRLVTVSRRL